MKMTKEEAFSLVKQTLMITMLSVFIFLVISFFSYNSSGQSVFPWIEIMDHKVINFKALLP